MIRFGSVQFFFSNLKLFLFFGVLGLELLDALDVVCLRGATLRIARVENVKNVGWQ